MPDLRFYWSGCRDLNSGPSVPQTEGFVSPLAQTVWSGYRGGWAASLWASGPAEELRPPLTRPSGR